MSYDGGLGHSSLRGTSLFRLVLLGLTALLPQRCKHVVLTRFFGWDIAPSAVVGLSIVSAGSVRMAAGARIGHANLVIGTGRLELGAQSVIDMGNVINGCSVVALGEHTSIGQRNWISGPRSADAFPGCPDRRPEFRLGAHSALTRAHRVECADSVTIGSFTSIGGRQAEFITHGVDVYRNIVRTQPIQIGDYCLTSTRCILQPGTVLPDRTMVAPGAVVHGKVGQPEQLIGGVPARPVKSLVGGKHFYRTEGPVHG